MTTSLNIATETAKLINEMSVKVLYYEARLCDCVGANHGAYDPGDSCINGFRYKPVVEYNLLRTSIDFRRVSQKAGMILQGGCQITIPRLQLSHHAIITGPDLSGGVDLSTEFNINVKIDGGTATRINCKLKAADETDVSVAEIVWSINSVGLGEVAYESGANGDPDGGGYVSLISLKAGSGSSIVFLPPDAKDGSNAVFYLNPGTYPHRYVPHIADTQFLRLYDRVSRGDVMVIDDRSRRDNAILKRGTLDRIKSFNVTRITQVAKGETLYRENIDFSFDGTTITWLANKGPATGENYTVEYLAKPNYVVFEELPTDRGADTDIIAKRIHLALRNYIEAGLVMNLPIDREVAFTNGFSLGYQLGN